MVVFTSISARSARRAEVQALHQDLIAPLAGALVAEGFTDPVRTARYVWGVVDVAIARIENGESSVVAESAALIAFVGLGMR